MPNQLTSLFQRPDSRQWPQCLAGLPGPWSPRRTDSVKYGNSLLPATSACWSHERWERSPDLCLVSADRLNILNIYFFNQFAENLLLCLVLLCPCGKFESPYQGKAQQLQEQHYLFLSVCAVFSCVQTMVWLPVFGIFNVRTDADVCNCMCAYGHGNRVGTGNWLWEKNSLLHWGLEPISVLLLAFRSDALPTELFLPVHENTKYMQ